MGYRLAGASTGISRSLSPELGQRARPGWRAAVSVAAAVALAAVIGGCASGDPEAGGDAPGSFSWTREEAEHVSGGAEASAYEAEGAAWEAPGGALSADAVDLGSTDAASELHSSATRFDTSDAWPLSMTEKVEGLIGEDVASRLLGDLDEYLEPHGISVERPLDVMVSEAGVRRSWPDVRFRVMVYHAADRIVIDCDYDEETGRHAFARQP